MSRHGTRLLGDDAAALAFGRERLQQLQQARDRGDRPAQQLARSPAGIWVKVVDNRALRLPDLVQVLDPGGGANVYCQAGEQLQRLPIRASRQSAQRLADAGLSADQLRAQTLRAAQLGLYDLATQLCGRGLEPQGRGGSAADWYSFVQQEAGYPPRETPTSPPPSTRIDYELDQLSYRLADRGEPDWPAHGRQRQLARFSDDRLTDQRRDNGFEPWKAGEDGMVMQAGTFQQTDTQTVDSEVWQRGGTLANSLRIDPHALYQKRWQDEQVDTYLPPQQVRTRQTRRASSQWQIRDQVRYAGQPVATQTTGAVVRHHYQLRQALGGERQLTHTVSFEGEAPLPAYVAWRGQRQLWPALQLGYRQYGEGEALQLQRFARYHEQELAPDLADLQLFPPAGLLAAAGQLWLDGQWLGTVQTGPGNALLAQEQAVQSESLDRDTLSLAYYQGGGQTLSEESLTVLGDGRQLWSWGLFPPTLPRLNGVACDGQSLQVLLIYAPTPQRESYLFALVAPEAFSAACRAYQASDGSAAAEHDLLASLQQRRGDWQNWPLLAMLGAEWGSGGYWVNMA